MTKYIRSIEPEGVTISVGGEIGEIGTTVSASGDSSGITASNLSLIHI